MNRFPCAFQVKGGVSHIYTGYDNPGVFKERDSKGYEAGRSAVANSETAKARLNPDKLKTKEQVLEQILRVAAEYAADSFAAVLDGTVPPLTHPIIPGQIVRGPAAGYFSNGYFSASDMRQHLLDAWQNNQYIYDAVRRVARGMEYHLTPDSDELGYPNYTQSEGVMSARRRIVGTVLTYTLQELDSRGYPVIPNYWDPKERKTVKTAVLPMTGVRL